MNSPNFRGCSNLLIHSLLTNFSGHMTKDQVLVANIRRIEYFLRIWHLVGSHQMRLEILNDSNFRHAVVILITLVHLRCVLSRHYGIELKVVNQLLIVFESDSPLPSTLDLQVLNNNPTIFNILFSFGGHLAATALK